MEAFVSSNMSLYEPLVDGFEGSATIGVWNARLNLERQTLGDRVEKAFTSEEVYLRLEPMTDLQKVVLFYGIDDINALIEFD